SDQRVEEELDRGIFFPRAAPDADQKIHRQQRHFEEDIEQKKVQAEEHAEDSGFQEEEKGHVALGHLVDVPGGDAGEEADEGGEDDEREGEAVDAYEVFDVEGGDPGGAGDHLDDAGSAADWVLQIVV